MLGWIVCVLILIIVCVLNWFDQIIFVNHLSIIDMSPEKEGIELILMRFAKDKLDDDSHILKMIQGMNQLSDKTMGLMCDIGSQSMIRNMIRDQLSSINFSGMSEELCRSDGIFDDMEDELERFQSDITEAYNKLKEQERDMYDALTEAYNKRGGLFDLVENIIDALRAMICDDGPVTTNDVLDLWDELSSSLCAIYDDESDDED